MLRRFLLALFLASAGFSARAFAHYPKLIIDLPDGVFSEKVEVRYTLYGSFGAYGSFVRPKPQLRSLEIKTSVDQHAAKEIRIIIWAPGCKLSTFASALNDQPDVHVPFLCESSPPLKVLGQIRTTLVPSNPNAQVSVTYLAHWACGFFGFADCVVPQFDVGAAPLDANGRFEIELPDFGLNQAPDLSANDADFVFGVRHTKTWNRLAELQPESESLRRMGGMKVLSKYPDNVVFIASKPK